MVEGFDLDSYLNRVGFAGELKPDLATLAKLQAAQVTAIPFEALDPFLRRPVSLEPAALQQKLVRSRRGGYCFELNSLFQQALEAIGFSVTGLGARVRWMSAPDQPLGPREHMLLKVETPEGPHLVDVGFGACMLDAPLPLVVGADLETPLGVYRLSEEDGRLALSAQRGEDLRKMYVFDLQPQLPSDFMMGNWFTSTHSAPPFQHFVIMERIVGLSRRKIVNRRYIVEGPHGAIESERMIADAQDLGRLLEDEFAITPPVPVAELFALMPAA